MKYGKREYRAPRPGEIQCFLATHAKDIKPRGNDELRFRPSPCCQHDKPQNMSCQINAKTGLWRCFACSAVGNWFQLTNKFGSPLPAYDRFLTYEAPIIDHGIIKMFQEQKRTPVTSGKYPGLLAYCHSMRGLKNETLDAWRVSSMGEHNLRWPIYAWQDDGWKIVNTRVRACLNRDQVQTRDWFGMTGGPTGLLIGNHLMEPDHPTKRAIIFEGQWDAMIAYQIGFRNVFSLPNGAANVRVGEMLRYIPDDWEIWLAMDMDDAGQQATERFFAQLGVERIARLILPHKDLNDWYLKDPTITVYDVESTARGMTESLQTRQVGYMELDFDGSDGIDYTPAIISSTPWLKLTDYYGGGLRAGETTSILGPSGKGKTTIVNQMGIHAAKQGIRVGVISLEGPREALKNKVKSTIRSLCRNDSGAMLSTASRFAISPLCGVKVTAKDLLGQVEKFLQEGCKIVIVDNLDFCLSGDSNLKSMVYRSIIDLAGDFSAHALVVWQPHKIDKDKIINSGDQKGFSQALQDSDNYIAINAVDGYRRLDVEKVRETGVTDGSVWLEYDNDTKLLTQIPNPQRKAGAAAPVVDLDYGSN